MNKKRNDIILILCIFLVALIAFAAMALTGNDGAIVQVTLDGKHYGEYRLDSDTRVTLGDELATLVIENGSAHIENATCPDKLCEKQGKINKNGHTLACLPNQIVISVKSDEDIKVDFTQ